MVFNANDSFLGIIDGDGTHGTTTHFRRMSTIVRVSVTLSGIKDDILQSTLTITYNDPTDPIGQKTETFKNAANIKEIQTRLAIFPQIPAV